MAAARTGTWTGCGAAAIQSADMLATQALPDGPGFPDDAPSVQATSTLGRRSAGRAANRINQGGVSCTLDFDLMRDPPSCLMWTADGVAAVMDAADGVAAAVAAAMDAEDTATVATAAAATGGTDDDEEDEEEEEDAEGPRTFRRSCLMAGAFNSSDVSEEYEAFGRLFEVPAAAAVAAASPAPTPATSSFLTLKGSLEKEEEAKDEAEDEDEGDSSGLV